MAVLPGGKALLARRSDRFEDFYDCETVDGVDVERPPPSVRAKAMASCLACMLSNFGIAHNLGRAYTEMKIALPGGRNVRRIPDVAFIPFTRWAACWEVPDVDAWAIVPDLCIQVISPNDLALTYDRKIHEYFGAGVKQVWVVNPDLQIVHIYESLDRMRTLRRKDTLSGIDFLPGFELPLAEVFLEDPPVAK